MWLDEGGLKMPVVMEFRVATFQKYENEDEQINEMNEFVF
jgi:hypothetical protein